MLQILQAVSYLTSILTASILLLRPLRHRLTGERQLRDGQKCLLRSDMLRTYYKNRDTHTIRQYELENFLFEYRAYKALGGNSFIDCICRELETWDVVT